MIIDYPIIFSIHNEFADNPEKLIPYEEFREKGRKVIGWKVMDRSAIEQYWSMIVTTAPI